MSFRAALRSRLIAANTNAGTRIYPRKLPQTVTLPAITYHLVSKVSVDSQTGRSNLAYERYQVTAWGTGDDQTDVLAQQIQAAIGSVAEVWSGYNVTSRLAGSLDLTDPETGRFMVPCDFFISHEEQL